MQDRALLNEAVRQRRCWDAIYYARQLMRPDSPDPYALAALASIPGEELVYRDALSGRPRVNPLLGPMDAQARFDLIQSSEIVECDPGEILFQAGDPGETMFIVLRGEIGVLFDAAGGPRVRLGVGEIVGELAFALRRRRTATLRCLTRTVLLSFSPQAVEAMVEGRPSGPAMRRALTRFIIARTLEHLCNNLGCLIGRDGSGPLRETDQPWLRMGEYAALLERPGGAGRTVSPLDRDIGRPGLYVLVSGQLREAGRPERLVDGGDLPILYANFPGAGLRGTAVYEVAADAVIVRIGAAAFTGQHLPRHLAEAVIAAIRAAVAER